MENFDKIASNISSLIRALGENTEREGLLKTPARSAKALEFLTSGYQAQLEEIVGDAIYNEDSSEIVVIKDIEVYSLCEHHLLPFFGKAHVAYIPRGKVIGLSKIPRIVDAFSRRLQLQERLTTQISHAVQKILEPEGVGVIIEASHLCMMMRGVQKQNSQTITSSLLGEFLKSPATRSELMQLIKG